MFEIFISAWFYAKSPETVPQGKVYTTIEACEAVLPFYVQAMNQYVWNDPKLREEVKYVHVTCAKKGTSEDDVLNKIINERFTKI